MEESMVHDYLFSFDVNENLDFFNLLVVKFRLDQKSFLDVEHSFEMTTVITIVGW